MLTLETSTQQGSIRTTGDARSRIPPSTIRLNRTGLGQARMSLSKGRSQSPVLQISYMPFKHRIDEKLFRSFLGKQSIGCLVSPVQRQGCRIWNEEVVEVNAWIRLHQFISHAGPRQIVYPSRVHTEKLRRPGGDPFGQSIVVLWRGGDLPSHDEEHYIPARISVLVFKAVFRHSGSWYKRTVLRPAPEGWINQGRCSACL